MRLGTRLFLIVGALLLAICLVIFLVPVFVVTQQADVSRESYLNIEREQLEESRANHLKWLQEEFGFLEGAIDSSMYFVASQPETLALIADDPADSTQNIWLTAAQIMGLAEYCDLLQIARPGPEYAVLPLAKAKLYPIWEVTINKDLSWILVDDSDGKEAPQVYFGILLPPIAKEYFANAYLPGQVMISHNHIFFEPAAFLAMGDAFTKAAEKVKTAMGPAKTFYTYEEFFSLVILKVLNLLEEGQKYLDSTFKGDDLATKLKELQSTPRPTPSDDPGTISSYIWSEGLTGPLAKTTSSIGEFGEAAYLAILTEEVYTTILAEMATVVSFMYAGELPWNSPNDKGSPAGASRIVSDEVMGMGSFTTDLLSTHPVIDPAAHLRRFPPVDDRLPIARDFELVPASVVGGNTLVSTMEVPTKDGGKAYLSLGLSFDSVLDKLASITGDYAFQMVDGELFGSVPRKGSKLGHQLDNEFRDAFPQMSQGSGFVTVGGTEFYYVRYQPKTSWNMEYITLRPAKEVLAPVLKFEARSKELVTKLAMHIFWIAIGVFVIALIVLEVIAWRFTKPIRKLAKASEVVGEGKYDHVELPHFHKVSKNEVSVLSGAFGKMVHGLKEREKIRGVLDKVVSKEIADEILKGRVQLGGEVKEVTVLFADLRHFTKLSEQLSPEEVIMFINGYMNVFTEMIEGHRGVIDKYIGDEIMALYGAPVPHEHSPLQAILSALHIMREVKSWNEERRAHGVIAADVGIGIHTGPMVAGNMGAEARLNYTVLGANVNLAARLCDEAGGEEILITKSMYAIPQVLEVIDAQPRSTIRLKGFSEPIDIYRVVGLKEGFELDELTKKVK